MTTPNTYIHNPHLEGDPFTLPGTNNKGVLLFHGFTATPAEVRKLGRVLNRLGYTVRAPMLPGHGTTPADLNRTTYRDWLDAAEAAYADLAGQCKSVIVGGESNGGLISLYLAAQHPEIAAVLAYAPALLLPLTLWQRIQLRLFAPIVKTRPKTDLTGNTTWQGYNVNPLMGAQQILKLQAEVRPLLPRIQQPILIVQSRFDRTIVPGGAQIVYDRVGSKLKELHWMSKSGHCVLLNGEQHEVHRLTMDFLFKVR